MKILVTGARRFVGRNLCAQLKDIRDGKARYYGIGARVSSVQEQEKHEITVDEVFEYDIDSAPKDLEAYCSEADFVFNLAGVNRPKDTREFMEGNFGFASTLLDTLKKHNNTSPVMLSSSQQASLAGRFGNSEYGRSRAIRELLIKWCGENIDLWRNAAEERLFEFNSLDLESSAIDPVFFICSY